MKSKESFIFWNGLLIMFSLSFCINLAFAAPKIRSLATASLGGTYYIIGSAVADIINRSPAGIKVIATIAQGSVGNVKLVGTNESELGMTNYYSGMSAIEGLEPFWEKFDIAGICKLQKSILQMVTFADREDIKTVADLRGKKLAVGPPGGGGVLLFKKILPFWNLDFEDIKPSYLSYSDGSEALKDKKVDMNIPHGAPPLRAVSGLTIQKNIKIISMERSIVELINNKFPYYEEAVIPANTYKGVNKDIYSVGVQDILIVNSSIDEEEVYNITKAIYDRLQDLRKIHPAMKDLTFDNYRNSLVPLHPGALKFYEEKGLHLE